MCFLCGSYGILCVVFVHLCCVNHILSATYVYHSVEVFSMSCYVIWLFQICFDNFDTYKSCRT